MSTEGVSDDLNESSGRIKFLNRTSDSGVDNSDSGNNSFIIMGMSDVSEESLVSVYCGEDGAITNQNAVIFRDIKSVEEWLKLKTDASTSVDSDIGLALTHNEDLSVSMKNSLVRDNSSNFEYEQIELCTRPVSSQPLNVYGGTEGSKNLDWENSITGSSKLYANAFNSGTGQNILILPELKNLENRMKPSAESFLNVSNIGQLAVLSSPIKSVSNNNISRVDLNKTQPERVIIRDLHKPKSTTKMFCSGVNKKLGLPLIRISKDCLMKGKLLGKSEMTLLDSKSPSLVSNASSTFHKPDSTKVAQTLVKPMIRMSQKPNIIRRRRQTSYCTSESAKVVVARPKNSLPVMAIPVKPLRIVSKDSLLKINQPKTLIKSDCLSEDSVINSFSDETNISVTHNNTHRPRVNDVTPLAVVAISTDKTDDTTEIIIKTESGENIYKGKTSDIMKATGSHTVNNLIKPKATNKGLNGTRLKASKEAQDGTAVSNLLTRILGVDQDVLESGDNLFSCPVEGCSHVTTKASSLKVHMAQHDNSGPLKTRPFKCDFPGCSWAFYTSFRLKRHQEIHLQKHAFECPIEGCNRSFSTTYNVNTHVKLHQRPTAVTCSVEGCDKAFQTRKSYEKHLQDHGLDYAPYTCSKEGCGKKYFTINSLNSHSRIHQHTEEELKCSYCGKVFDAPCRLKSHINMHIGVKPYKCDYEGCMWSFITSSKLRRHQRKHTQLRKHPCKVCGKAFLRSEHLKDHTLKHFVKKSFVCPIADCGAVLLNKSSMYAHLKKHRNQEVRVSENQTYPCPMEGCDLVFNAKENLRAHLQLMHMGANSIADNISQDTIQMLSDDNLISFESMQSNSSNTGTVTFNSMTQEGLLVGMSDLVQCIPPMEEEEYDDSNTEGHIITHVVFTDDTDADVNSSTVPEEPQIILTEIEEEIGSARTGLTYQEAVETKRHVTEYEIEASADSQPAGLHSASDVVLSAGSVSSHSNLDRTGLMLQDDLTTGDLYGGMGGPTHEEGLLGPPGGELQVLLLDSSNRLQHSDFEQSTINLRDLE